MLVSTKHNRDVCYICGCTHYTRMAVVMYTRTKLAIVLFVVIGSVCLYTINYSSYGGIERIHEIGLTMKERYGSERNELPVNDSVPDYLIPDGQVLSAMTETDLMKIYWRYINRLQILCKDIARIGNLKDGGKEICEDEPYKPQAPCLIYSFGINYMFDFDIAVVQRYGCEVHCFDPSMNNTKVKPGLVYRNVYVHDWGLGGEDMVNSKRWTIKTLASIKQVLGHTNRSIDLLKIDIEGDEWPSIPQMLSSGAIDDVRQISMETHFAKEHPHNQLYFGNLKSDAQLTALRLLYEAGYRIFMRERNMWSFHFWPGVQHYLTNVNEISMIKVKR